jgi:hypothetical protein
VAVAASFVEYVRNTPVDEDEQLLLEAAFAAGKADR